MKDMIYRADAIEAVFYVSEMLNLIVRKETENDDTYGITGDSR